MPRSAADATRFTATGPVVNSSATTIDVMLAAGPAPPNETPQQKVARLREAARRVKAGTETTSDRLLRHGRKWADGAHRVTVMGLIGLSGTCLLLCNISVIIEDNKAALGTCPRHDQN